jgi:hypothetical protein
MNRQSQVNKATVMKAKSQTTKLQLERESALEAEKKKANPYKNTVYPKNYQVCRPDLAPKIEKPDTSIEEYKEGLRNTPHFATTNSASCFARDK